MINQPKRILIRGVNWIGDAVLTLPALKAIRKSFPDAHITLLVKPWVADVFSNNSAIDEIILYDQRFIGLWGKIRLARLLRREAFDMAILLQNAFDAAFITWLAGITERIGYKKDGRAFLLTKGVTVKKNTLDKHQVYYYLDLIKVLGIESSEDRPYIDLQDEERQWARDLISSSFIEMETPLIGINPGATYGSAKRWPPEHFAQLIINIITDLKARIILFGSGPETAISNEIIRQINKLKIKLRIEQIGSQILVMTGKTNLRQLAALIAECDAFVTNDSGPLHMASALLVPTAAIFGSTDPKKTGPFGEGHTVVTKNIPCSPCMKRECPEKHLRCMTELSPHDVFSVLQEIIPTYKAVLLDKDGTLIVDQHYLNSFDDLLLIPGVKEGLRKLKDTGFKLIGITNQSGIARGIVDRNFVAESNAYLQKELGIDNFYFCPHHPDERCPCRKPEPMMALLARISDGINLKKSYIIGDKESDVLLARKIGATGILLSSTPLFESTSAAYLAKNMDDAVDWILDKEKKQSW